MTNHGSESSRRRGGWVVGLSAAAVGLLVLLLLHPASGIDRQPPECYPLAGYVVPCGSGFAIGFTVVGALLAGAVAYALERRSRR